MKRCFWMPILLVLCVPIVVIGQSTDKTTAIIKQMDHDWIIESYFTKELKDFDRIAAVDAVFTNGVGKVADKAAKRAELLHNYTDPSARAAPGYVFEIDPQTHSVRVFDKTAVSTGYVAEDYFWKTQHIKNRVYFTNTYLKRKGEWQLVASQYTNVKQP